jgi:hypothetical protein
MIDVYMFETKNRSKHPYFLSHRFPYGRTSPPFFPLQVEGRVVGKLGYTDPASSGEVKPKLTPRAKWQAMVNADLLPIHN